MGHTHELRADLPRRHANLCAREDLRRIYQALQTKDAGYSSR